MVEQHDRRRVEAVTITGRDFQIWKWLVPGALSMLAAGMMWIISTTVELQSSMRLIMANDQEQSVEIDRHAQTFQRLALVEQSISNVELSLADIKGDLIGRTRDRYSAEQAERDLAAQQRMNDRMEETLERLRNRLLELERGMVLPRMSFPTTSVAEE